MEKSEENGRRSRKTEEEALRGCARDLSWCCEPVRMTGPGLSCTEQNWNTLEHKYAQTTSFPCFKWRSLRLAKETSVKSHEAEMRQKGSNTCEFVMAELSIRIAQQIN